jgi:hypothetical protein
MIIPFIFTKFQIMIFKPLDQKFLHLSTIYFIYKPRSAEFILNGLYNDKVTTLILFSKISFTHVDVLRLFNLVITTD